MENENEKYQCYLKSLEEERKESSIGCLTVILTAAIIAAAGSFAKWVENRNSSKEEKPVKIEEKSMPIQKISEEAKEYQHQ